MAPENTAERWARLRFAIIGKLLVNPPAHGTLQEELLRLSDCTWKHPTTGNCVTFSFSTIERWYYKGRDSPDPILALRRQVRKDAETARVIGAQLFLELQAQYRAHPSWSYQLHADNIKALTEQKPDLGDAPGYATVRRTMHKHGWIKRPRKRADTEGGKKAQARLEKREVRSFEAPYAHALWHFDFHKGRRHIVDEAGQHHTPICLCILDDYSRLVCHIQWFLDETAETLIHGLCQAFLKRGLPRGVLSDNGSAMIAAETKNGLEALSVVHNTTLPYSPYQNGKQESFWGQLEGRLMAMLESVDDLSLSFLNYATQAWVEQDYHRERHDEIGTSPLERMLSGTSVARPCPEMKKLRLVFTEHQKRTQRRSDGTVSIHGVRFEIPSRFAHLKQVFVRFARWDLTCAYLLDPQDSLTVLSPIRPQNKQKNADGNRRVRHPEVQAQKPAKPIPPLLHSILADYQKTGLPPAYIPGAAASKTMEKK